MTINLGSIVKTLRAEEKSLELQLRKIKNAIAAFAGFNGSSPSSRKRSSHSAKSRAAISKAQKARWKKFRAAKRRSVKVERTLKAA